MEKSSETSALYFYIVCPVSVFIHTSTVLVLKEMHSNNVPVILPLFRQVMFSFEAGRRCDSGPGNFTFETKQGNEIFMLVDQAIQSQKALAEERRLSYPLNPDPDCPPSLQNIRSAAPCAMMAGSGDSSSCSSREADGDSGGSKPGSADGVLGKREGGDGGRGQGGGAGHKGRSLPEPPVMLGTLGGGTPPRSPRGQAGKGMPSPDEHVGLYSEPVDSVRLPLHSSDCVYSDPVDSIKGQNHTGNPCTPPVPTPRLRPVGDDTSGGGGGDHHQSRKPPDLYSHFYDCISGLSLNGAAGGGRGAGRGANISKRPPGGQAEGASSPPVLCQEHIYDEPEGRAKGTGTIPSSIGMGMYDEARLELHSQRRQEEATTPSGPENHSTSSQGKPSETQRPAPLQLGPSRSTQQPPAPKWPKPVTAPKPNKGAFARKDPVPLPPGRHGGLSSNMNNNNNMWGSGGGGRELYSKVSKQKPLPGNLWYSPNHQAPLKSPDIIYDNLGDI